MRDTRLSILIAGLLPLLTACSATGWQPRPVPFADAGAVLELRQPLRFPADTTRIYFQGGRMTNARGITVWEHHCALALDHAFETDLNIPVGPVPVVSTQRRISIGAASRGVATYENSFLFDASAHPLYALYCEIWVTGDGVNERHYISADELGRVLGDWAVLRPADDPESEGKLLK